MGATYTPAQAEASARFKEKYYKRILLELRLEEDADIIEAISEAKEHGITKREWLSELFYAKPQIPEGLIPINSVEEKLYAFRVQNADIIIEELRKEIKK